MGSVLETLIWIVAGALVVGLVAFIVLRWLAVRIATRVAAEAEARVAAAVAQRIRRTGGPNTPVVTDDALQRRYLADIDRIAKVMDGLIPLPVIGGVGLDAVIGLVPVLGDAIALSAASLITVRAAQLGAPPELLGRLVSIQVLDLLFGAVPVIGDLVDAGYRANQRSADLVHEWIESGGLSRPPRPGRAT